MKKYQMLFLDWNIQAIPSSILKEDITLPHDMGDLPAPENTGHMYKDAGIGAATGALGSASVWAYKRVQLQKKLNACGNLPYGQIGPCRDQIMSQIKNLRNQSLKYGALATGAGAAAGGAIGYGDDIATHMHNMERAKDWQTNEMPKIAAQQKFEAEHERVDREWKEAEKETNEVAKRNRDRWADEEIARADEDRAARESERRAEEDAKKRAEEDAKKRANLEARLRDAITPSEKIQAGGEKVVANMVNPQQLDTQNKQMNDTINSNLKFIHDPTKNSISDLEHKLELRQQNADLEQKIMDNQKMAPSANKTNLNSIKSFVSGDPYLSQLGIFK